MSDEEEECRPVPPFEWTPESLWLMQQDTSPFCPSGDWFDIRFHLLMIYSIARHVNWKSPQWPAPAVGPRCAEIGVREGPSTLAILTAMKETGGGLVSIECDPKSIETTRRIVDQAGLGEYWDAIEGLSEDVSGQFADNELDLLLIDGLHSEGQVRKEIELYRGKVRRDGFMLFHDYHSDSACLLPPVSEPYPSGASVPIEELRATGDFEIIVFPWSYGLAVARRIR